MGEVEQTISHAGEGLGKKLGPLPVWAWIAFGVGGAAAAYYLIAGRKGGASAFSNLPPGSLLDQLGGASGAGGGGTSAGAPATASASQIQSALNQVATQLQVPFSEVSLYWQEYMAGTAPVGSSQASGAFSNVVNSILTTLGSNAPAPATSGGVNANPFTNNTTWLNAILSALPSGTSASITSELTQLVNGTTTSISQDAANALSAAEAVVGVGPSPLAYSITPPPAKVVPQLPPGVEGPFTPIPSFTSRSVVT